MAGIPGFREELDEILALHLRKNADYALEGDPFSNFRACEALGICSVEQGILVRMTDKLSRVANLIGSGKDAKVIEESVEDTLRDNAVYSLILKLYVKRKREAAAQSVKCVNEGGMSG